MTQSQTQIFTDEETKKYQILIENEESNSKPTRIPHARSLIVDSCVFFYEESESAFRFELALQALELSTINGGKKGESVKQNYFWTGSRHFSESGPQKSDRALKNTQDRIEFVSYLQLLKNFKKFPKGGVFPIFQII